MDKLLIVKKGGAGSGHHGHAGRKGQRGGSVPGKAGKSALLGNVTELHGTPDGVSETYVGQLDDGTKVMVKEAKVGAEDTTMAEVTVYETAKLLGYEDLMTEVQLRDDGSSVQRWVSDGRMIHETVSDYDVTMGTARANVNADDMKRVMLLDALTGNGDRHAGNILVKPNGRVVAIDNDYGFTETYVFGVRPSMRYTGKVYNRYTGQNITLTASDFDHVLNVARSPAFESLVRSKSDASWSRTVDRIGTLEQLQQEAASSGGLTFP